MNAYPTMLVALLASVAAFGAQASNGEPKIVRALPLGTIKQVQPTLPSTTPFYSNITTLSGFSFGFGPAQPSQLQPGGTTGRLTAMSCDDLSLNPGTPSGSYTLRKVTFSISNPNAFDVQTVPTLLFYDQANGGVIDAVAFNSMSIPPGGMLVTGDLSAVSPSIVFPLDANGEANIWMCQIYGDDGGIIGTPMDDLGAFLCDPPTVGSSPDNIYASFAPIASYATLPSGIQGNFGGSPVANYCNELSE